jgi:hypothetical protein
LKPKENWDNKMDVFDSYCLELLEESKRFLEIAIENNKSGNVDSIKPFLRSSILLAHSSLEAYVNNICLEFETSKALTLHEKAFLLEKEITFANGVFSISERLKMTRLIERIELICTKFKRPIDRKSSWWSQLKEGIEYRNSIVHPKESKEISIEITKRSIQSIIQCIDALFLAVYKRKFPKSNMELNSKLNFR